MPDARNTIIGLFGVIVTRLASRKYVSGSNSGSEQKRLEKVISDNNLHEMSPLFFANKAFSVLPFSAILTVVDLPLYFQTPVIT